MNFLEKIDGATVDIFASDGSVLYSVLISDDSSRISKIMGENQVTLRFSLPEYIDIPVGSYIEYKARRYTLYKPENFTKNGTRNFNYTVIFEAYQALLGSFIYRNTTPGDRRLKFAHTARPHEHIEMLIANLNQKDPVGGWSVGECIEDLPKEVQFNLTPCDEALRMIADAFETEWEIDNKTIHLRKVEYSRDSPLPLSYGLGNGFKTGIGRQNYDSTRPIERLFAQGGTRNIDFSKYGSQELLLPAGQTIRFDGAHFEDEAGFNEEISRQYLAEDDGYSVIRADEPLKTNAEGSVDLSHIYPMREGTVTAVVVVDAEKNQYDFFDNTIPDSLNYADYRINGEKMTVIFQSGMLAGREFDIEQTDDAVTGYVHIDPNDPAKNRRFLLVPQEMDGQWMPNETFKPAVGDKYAVFGMMMPDEYVRDDASKSGASWDMFRQAVRYKFDNEDDRFTFIGELNGIWAQENWPSVGGHLIPGGFIKFSDNQFYPEGTLIRITGIQESITKPYSPKLTLSNVTRTGNVRNELSKIDQNEVVVDHGLRELQRYTRRQWRDVAQTEEMIKKLFLNFSESINPITIRTMQLIAGDESLQFRFVNNKTNPQEIDLLIYFDIEDKQMKCDAGILQHMTMGITSVSPTHKASEYKFWDIPSFTSGVLADPDKSYYLYARVLKNGTTGTFRLEEKPQALEIGEYYYLLVGILNSEIDGSRSYTSMFGFTEVSPGRLLTNLLISSSGLNYFNLVSGAFRSGKFSGSTMVAGVDIDPDRADVLRIKGAIVQNAGGYEEVLGVYRGEYVRYSRYYENDRVTYNGVVYRSLAIQDSSVVSPGDSQWWEVYAKGMDGKDGNYTEYRFAANGSATTPPSLNTASENPSGWTVSMPTQGAGQYVWMTRASKSAAGTLLTTWSTPVRITGADGKDGDRGPMPRVSEWKSSGQYEYSDSVVDVVFVAGNPPVYYQAKKGAGIIPVGTPVTNTTYWQLMNWFENVATNLLIAQMAVIAGFKFYNDRIESQQEVSDGPKLILDANTGEMTVRSASLSNSMLNILKGEIKWGTIKQVGDPDNFIIELGTAWEVPYNDPIGAYSHMARIILSGLPKSSNGLSAGRVWQNKGTLKIKQAETEIVEELLAVGRVESTSSTAFIYYTSFDNGALSVVRVGTGLYRITVPSSFGSMSMGTHSIQLDGYDYVYGTSSNAAKATLISVSATNFLVGVSDDETMNDGNFMFRISKYYKV